MKSQDDDLREHAGFRGLRNNVSPTGFDLGDLVTALNVDIDDELFLHRRKGHSAVVVAGVDRDLWAAGALCLGVGSNALKRILPNWSATTLRSGLTPSRALSYAAVADRAYWTNGVESGVVQDGVNRTWGLAVPTTPVATATGGALLPGRYQYAVTSLRADGQESGASRAGLVTLTVTGGFTLTLTPPAVGDFVAVYVSDRDGEQLYRYAVVAAATTTFAVRESRTKSAPLQTQFLSPPPAGDIVAYGNGRMLVAKDNRLYPSEPYAPELFDLRKGYPFLDHLTLVAPLRDGTWVGTASQIAWLPNADPEQWQFEPRASYGVIPGTAAYGDGELIGEGAAKVPAVFFATPQGLCAGMQGGQLVNFTDGKYAYPAMNRGAGIVRRHRGIAQFLVSLQGVETAGNVAA